jgi:hypothetical protein
MIDPAGILVFPALLSVPGNSTPAIPRAASLENSSHMEPAKLDVLRRQSSQRRYRERLHLCRAHSTANGGIHQFDAHDSPKSEAKIRV